MKLINKNTDCDIVLRAKSSTGTVLDLTSASITASFKEFATATTNLFTKRNTAAGGSDSEIEVLDDGWYVIKILSDNTSSLNLRNIHCSITITISSVNYSDSFFLKILENKEAGTPRDEVVLQPYKKIVWTSVNGGTPTLRLKAGFTGTPTAVFDGTTLTLTSAELEFEATGDFFSNNRDYTIISTNTGEMVIEYSGSLTGTTTFGWEDETKVYITNNASAVTSITYSGNISKGTTAERTALGLTLGADDEYIFIDTTENTVYGWNGSEWV